jgi:hypothetical protein
MSDKDKRDEIDRFLTPEWIDQEESDRVASRWRDLEDAAELTHITILLRELYRDNATFLDAVQGAITPKILLSLLNLQCIVVRDPPAFPRSSSEVAQARRMPAQSRAHGQRAKEKFGFAGRRGSHVSVLRADLCS